MGNFMHGMKEFFGFVEEPPMEKSLPTQEIKRESLPQTMMKAASLSGKTRPFAITEIKIIEPRIYEDSLAISSNLRDGKPVILNLKYLDNDTSKRLIDFICGTAYAINGHMVRIGENIFLFTPTHILISDEKEKSTLEQGIEQNEKERFFHQTGS